MSTVAIPTARWQIEQAGGHHELHLEVVDSEPLTMSHMVDQATSLKGARCAHDPIADSKAPGCECSC